MKLNRAVAVAALAVTAFVGAAAPARAEVTGRDVVYEAGKGYFAADAAAAGTLPGVLVVHEWWGHNDYARRRARMLAGLGYAALAVDMYGDGKTAGHPDDAGAFSGALMKDPAAAKGGVKAKLLVLHGADNAEADAKSWEELRRFLAAVLR